MDPITFRRATLADADEILLHRRSMFLDMGFTDAVALDRMVAASRPQLVRMLNDGSYLGWLAVDANGKTCAGAGLHISELLTHPSSPDDARRAYIYNVYTYPDYRRRGLAKRLTQEILAWCRAQKIHTVWLHASDQGRPVYEAMGFVQTNEMKIILSPDPTQH